MPDILVAAEVLVLRVPEEVRHGDETSDGEEEEGEEDVEEDVDDDDEGDGVARNGLEGARVEGVGEGGPGKSKRA